MQKMAVKKKPLIQLLKSIKLNILLYLLIKKLWENIKHGLKIILYINNLIGELFLPTLRPFSTVFLMNCSASLPGLRECLAGHGI